MLVANSLVKMLIISFCAVIAISCGGNRQPPETTERPQPPKTYVFECLNKASYTVRFDRDQASIILPVGTVLLPRQPSSAGAKYSDGKTSIWQRGDIALMHMGGVPLGDCYNNPREAAWEHARLNGVSFRAAGDKP
jgi:putative lipoprotein